MFKKIICIIISFVLALVIALAGLSAFCVSAEETTYTQPEKFIYGDVDLDGNVTVKDATLIQKGLAKVTYVTAVQRYLADPDGTGYSIKNATAIQKYLAKYETTTPWNTEIIMASQDEFWHNNEPNYDFDPNCLIVSVKKGYGQNYSIEDFPEFDFNSIESWDETYHPDTNTTYTLYLSEPSKNNVIEARNILLYRTNIDLAYISVNEMHIAD